jgi:hypothetical protein
MHQFDAGKASVPRVDWLENVATIFSKAVLGVTPFIVTALVGTGAQAQIPYPTPGVENPVTYSFTASTTGDIVAYQYATSSAGFDEQLGMLVNGVDTGINGLDDHNSSEGDELDFGTVQAGSVLTLYINVVGEPGPYYSNPSLNGDGVNHVYSALFAGGLPNEGGSVPIPAGVYVGFEDMSPVYDGSSGFDYQDTQVVFTDVTMNTIPEPASWLGLVGGLVGLGLIASRRGRMHGTLAA